MFYTLGMTLDIRKVISIGILFAFLGNSFGPVPSVQAQDFRLPAPGVMVGLSPEFNPPILKGIKVHPDNPFRFDFILDKGNSRLSNDSLKDESDKLIKYFLASLTIPEKDLWVNLSPYEKSRIIPNSFGLTEMGRDLLAEDYMLKQITASLIYPEEEVGKKFWKRIYEEAAKKFGTTNIPVNTFNKVWIIPEKAVVYENSKIGAAYIVESKLKVMLEEDYLSLAEHEGIQSDHLQAINTNQLGSQIVREIVIPELTKEVNEGKNFVQLRQVYNSLILATWYKNKIKESILAQVYADKNKVAGVNIDDPSEKERIYQQYLRAFKKGVFNFIKETPTVNGASVPRKYFSGGCKMDMALLTSTKNIDEVPAIAENQIEEEVRIDSAMKAGSLNELYASIRGQGDENLERSDKANWYKLKTERDFIGFYYEGELKFSTLFAFENGKKLGRMRIGLAQNSKSVHITEVQMINGQITGMKFKGLNGEEVSEALWGLNEKGELERLDSKENKLKYLFKSIRGEHNSNLRVSDQDGWSDLKEEISFSGFFSDRKRFDHFFVFENGSGPKGAAIGVERDAEDVLIKAVQINKDGKIVGMLFKGKAGEGTKVDAQVDEQEEAKEARWGIDQEGTLAHLNGMAYRLKQLYRDVKGVENDNLRQADKDGWQQLKKKISFQGFYYSKTGQFVDLFVMENGMKPQGDAMGLMQGMDQVWITNVQVNREGKVVGIKFRGHRGKERKRSQWGLNEEGKVVRLDSIANKLKQFYKEIRGENNTNFGEIDKQGWCVLKEQKSFKQFCERGYFKQAFVFENGQGPKSVWMGLMADMDDVMVTSVQINKDDGKIVGMKYKGQKGEKTETSQWGLNEEGQLTHLDSQENKSNQLYKDIRGEANANLGEIDKHGWQQLTKKISFKEFVLLSDGKFQTSFQFENGKGPGQVGMGLMMGMDDVWVTGVQINKDAQIVGMKYEGKEGAETEASQWGLNEEGQLTHLDSPENRLKQLYKDIRGEGGANLGEIDEKGWCELKEKESFAKFQVNGYFLKTFIFEDGQSPEIIAMGLMGDMDEVWVTGVQIKDGKIVGMKYKGQRGEKTATSQWGWNEEGQLTHLDSMKYRLKQLYKSIRGEGGANLGEIDEYGWRQLNNKISFKEFCDQTGKFLVAFTFENGRRANVDKDGKKAKYISIAGMTRPDHVWIAAVQERNGKIVGMNFMLQKGADEAEARWGLNVEGQLVCLGIKREKISKAKIKPKKLPKDGQIAGRQRGEKTVRTQVVRVRKQKEARNPIPVAEEVKPPMPKENKNDGKVGRPPVRIVRAVVSKPAVREETVAEKSRTSGVLTEIQRNNLGWGVGDMLISPAGVRFRIIGFSGIGSNEETVALSALDIIDFEDEIPLSIAKQYRRIPKADVAMNSGGIDLASVDKHLQTQNGGERIQFHLDQAQLAQLQNAPGFVPVIINIQPMTNLRLWLGINDQNPLVRVHARQF